MGSPPRSRWHAALEALVPLLAVACFCGLAWSQGVCTQDDAFISFRYARNFAEGHGLVYNPGEPVEGYTNFLWTVLLALAMRLGADPVAVSRWLGIAFGAGLVALTWRLAARSVGDSPWLRAVPTVLLALTPPVFVEAAMGLETSMFAFLVLLGCERCVAEFESPRRLPLHALVFALASLTRPEGPLTYLLAVGSCTLLARRDLRRLLPFLSRSALLFALPVGLHLLWRLDYYGVPFPNTFYAKTGGDLRHVRGGVAYLAHLLGQLGWAVPFLILVAWTRIRRPAVLVLQSLTLGYVAYVVTVGGDFKPTYRFFVPILAPAWLLVGAGLAAIRDLLLRRSLPEPWATASVAIAGVALAFPLRTGFEATYRLAELRREAVADPIRREISAWFGEHTPPGEILAMPSAGLIPFYSGVRVIDMWGLTDPVIARSSEGGDSLAGHQRSNPSYLLSREPLYFLFMPRHGLRRRIRLRGQYAVERQILALPEFHERYELLNEPLSRGHLYVYRRKARHPGPPA